MPSIGTRYQAPCHSVMPSVAGVATAFLEPDPDTRWTERRLTELYRSLDEWA